MSVFWVIAGRDSAAWRDAIAARCPEHDVRAWPQEPEPQSVSYLACWKPPPDALAPLTRLRAIFALGAGIDALLARPDLPEHVPLIKLADAGMAAQMLEYVLIGVLSWQRRLPEYAIQQAEHRWQPLPGRYRENVRVGVLGLGAIGSQVALGLASFGYRVAGWSRSPKTLPRVNAHSGEAGLADLLGGSDVLINLLPSTEATRGLLDRARLAALPTGAFVVNAARGDQLDSSALRELLDAGHLGGALLDVFASEPLPPDDPLWSHPRVTITPHVAAITLIEPAAEQIAESLRRIAKGQPVRGLVERGRGY